MDDLKHVIEQFIDDFEETYHFPLKESALLTADLQNLYFAQKLAISTKLPLPFIKINVSVDLFPERAHLFSLSGVKSILTELLRDITQPELLDDTSIYLKVLFEKTKKKTLLLKMNLSIYLIGPDILKIEKWLQSNLYGRVKHITGTKGEIENGTYLRWVDLFQEFRIPLGSFSPISYFEEKKVDVDFSIKEFEQVALLLYNPILLGQVFTPNHGLYDKTYHFNPILQKAELQNEIFLWFYGLPIEEIE
jgi:hypothetical protein